MDKVLWGIAIILVIVAFVGTAYTSIHSDQIVEKYCSVVYKYNVDDYKVCKELSQTELIEKLTKDFDKKNGVPDLEEIK